MRIETDEGFISFIANGPEEIKLFQPFADAINAKDPRLPAQIVDNLENGPENRIINGVLQIQIS